MVGNNNCCPPRQFQSTISSLTWKPMSEFSSKGLAHLKNSLGKPSNTPSVADFFCKWGGGIPPTPLLFWPKTGVILSPKRIFLALFSLFLATFYHFWSMITTLDAKYIICSPFWWSFIACIFANFPERRWQKYPKVCNFLAPNNFFSKGRLPYLRKNSTT